MELKIDLTTGDLDVSDNQVQTVGEGGQAIAQRVQIRLKTFYREWILDRSAGTKWYQKVFKKDADKYIVDQELRKRVQGTEGVSRIRYWKSSFNAQTREYDLDFIVVTAIEEVSIKLSLAA